MLRGSEAGVWRAVLRYGDRSVMVDRELGSWRVSPVADGVGWQDLRPEHAEVLQQLVRRESAARRRRHERRADGATSGHGPGSWIRGGGVAVVSHADRCARAVRARSGTPLALVERMVSAAALARFGVS